nr:nucleotidyltransferase family protein [Motiliproteus sp. SC1-56]
MAAGAGARFGGRKQFALIGKQTLIERALEPLKPLFRKDLYCVLGAHREALRPLVEPHARVIDHPGWAQGLGASIGHGMRQLLARSPYDAVLIALADQVALERADFQRLLEDFDNSRIVAARYAGKTGVPALFPAGNFGELAQLSGQEGARELLREKGREVIEVPMPRAEIDIDTPEDLEGFIGLRTEMG